MNTIQLLLIVSTFSFAMGILLDWIITTHGKKPSRKMVKADTCCIARGFFWRKLCKYPKRNETSNRERKPANQIGIIPRKKLQS